MRRTGKSSARGQVIVLGGATTPLAVVHCLYKAGYRPIVLSCAKSDISRFSRMCDFVHTQLDGAGDEEVLQWLVNYAKTLRSEHFIFPCSDRFALFLAEHQTVLGDSIKVWNNDPDDLKCLVEKTRLYEMAKSVGLPVPPGINEPGLAELNAWLAEHEPPYFVKPAYKGIPGASLAEKNRVFDNRNDLVDFVRRHGSRSLVIQRMIASGDGNLFDVYGLNDRNGVPVSLATHRRIRQWPLDRGITSFGEIPVTHDQVLASRIVEMTRRLFTACKYHGIYGVEWLRDPATGQLYLIDVNARPFSSIGHLADSGINLPYLAVREIDNELDNVDLPASTNHSYWIHFSRDIFSALAHVRRKHDLRIVQWFRQVVSARSFAFWTIRDLGPFFVASYRFIKKLGSIIVRRRRSTA